jgi:hypothetical protein
MPMELNKEGLHQHEHRSESLGLGNLNIAIFEPH